MYVSMYCMYVFNACRRNRRFGDRNFEASFSSHNISWEIVIFKTMNYKQHL